MVALSHCRTATHNPQVGLTEDECKKAGLSYKVGKFSFMANSRARAQDDAEGLVRPAAPMLLTAALLLRLSRSTTHPPTRAWEQSLIGCCTASDAWGPT
jgi:hypothetical protein